jgi:hypothetical protein
VQQEERRSRKKRGEKRPTEAGDGTGGAKTAEQAQAQVCASSVLLCCLIARASLIWSHFEQPTTFHLFARLQLVYPPPFHRLTF